MTGFEQVIAGDAPLLFDGGMGTLLQERGLTDGACGELWNVDRSADVRRIHQEYADAGARFLTTNTFGGTSSRLSMHGCADRVAELSQAAAEIARDVAEREGTLVAGNLGPTGELLTPMGALSPEEAQAIFAEQAAALLAGGADVFALETMSDLAEVQAAIAAVQAVAPGIPILATMSFDTNLHTMMGVSPEVAVKSLADEGVAAVGANCGRGPAEMEHIVTQMASARPDGLLLLAQSNAGLPQLVGDTFVYDAPPEQMAEHAVRLRDLGVDIIGACCGSTPAHIAAMRAALQSSDSTT